MSNKARKDTTFYLYDYTNTLAKKPKKIYSPYNYKTLGRTPSEDHYRDPDSVEFIRGVYELKVDEVGEKLYDEQAEWLNFYNTKGGRLSKGVGPSEFLNGRKFRNDGIHKIKTEEIFTGPKPKTTIVTEHVSVQQIPMSIIETMNMPQVEQLAVSWGVELPKDLREKGSASDIKEVIVGLLKENNNISK